MRIRALLLPLALLGSAYALSGALAGCKGSDDSAPTNTKDSTYVGGGTTEADKIGEQRRKARLPHGGAQ